MRSEIGDVDSVDRVRTKYKGTIEGKRDSSQRRFIIFSFKFQLFQIRR